MNSLAAGNASRVVDTADLRARVFGADASLRAAFTAHSGGGAAMGATRGSVGKGPLTGGGQ